MLYYHLLVVHGFAMVVVMQGMDVWNYNDYNGMYNTTQSRPNQPRPPLLCFGSYAFRPSLTAPLDRIRQRGILVFLTNLQLVNLIVIHHRVAAGSVFVSVVACQVTRMVPLVIGGDEACAFYWFSALRRGAQRAAGTQQESVPCIGFSIVKKDVLGFMVVHLAIRLVLVHVETIAFELLRASVTRETSTMPFPLQLSVP
jgi:hypothetical protein